MQITPELVDYVAALARLRLSEQERLAAQRDLSRILDYVGTLEALDTDGITPMSHAFPVQNVFREDVITPSMPRADILRNAPQQKDGCFLVPKTVE